MYKSIKTRLTVTICGILLIVFSVQIAVNFLLAEKYYVYQKTKMMKAVYQEIASQADSSDENIVLILRNLEMDNNLEILLADENMNLIYSNRPQVVNVKDPRINPMDFDFMKYPKSSYTTDPTVIKTDSKEGDRIRLLCKIDRKDSTYYLAIRLSVKSISSDMKSTNLFILYISSFAIAIGGLMVYFISKQFAKPIEDINKVAIHISDLDFTERAKEVQRKDEIGSLAMNINKMSDRLEENILSLQEANKKLKYDIEYMSKVDEQRIEFIANVSHELKTPLAILTGYAEMLNNDIPGIDKKFYYETIQDETQKMNALIKNLLDLSNMENSLANLNLEETDISKLSEQIFRKNSILMNKKGVIGEFSSDGDFKVMADPLYMEEAVNNYLSNALSYTEKGHRIHMAVNRRKEEAVVSVFNEGINISQENIDKIWNSFYREDKSRTRTSQNNVGLGLYIVRSIMNAHHGDCGVANKENGVEFWLSIKIQE